MGGGQSKPQTVIHDNNDKTEETQQLIFNIRTVLEEMKQNVQSNALVPSCLFRNLFNDLESLNSVLNPQRMHVCYIVGTSGVGKSSLINSITNSNQCNINDMAEAGTVDFKIISAPEVNTTFVDTIGFGSQLNDSALVSKFKTKLQNYDCPDSVLLVITPLQLKDRASLQMSINYINRVVQYVEKIRLNTSVPIICVLNQIDIRFPNGLSDSKECKEKIETHMQQALTIVNQYLKTKATQCVVTSAALNYGIDQLRSSINAQSPLNAQIISNDLDYTRKRRWIIANKIIAAFTATSAAVSFLPIADIIIVTILQEWMYRMLACFSVDPNRTPDTFKIVHRTLQGSSLVIRAGALVVGGIFQLSLVGYLIGAGICVAAAGASTAGLGWSCYYYFINETLPEEHKKLN